MMHNNIKGPVDGVKIEESDDSSDDCILIDDDVDSPAEDKHLKIVEKTERKSENFVKSVIKVFVEECILKFEKPEEDETVIISDNEDDCILVEAQEKEIKPTQRVLSTLKEKVRTKITTLLDNLEEEPHLRKSHSPDRETLIKKLLNDEKKKILNPKKRRVSYPQQSLKDSKPKTPNVRTLEGNGNIPKEPITPDTDHLKKFQDFLQQHFAQFPFPADRKSRKRKSQDIGQIYQIINNFLQGFMNPETDPSDLPSLLGQHYARDFEGSLRAKYSK